MQHARALPVFPALQWRLLVLQSPRAVFLLKAGAFISRSKQALRGLKVLRSQRAAKQALLIDADCEDHVSAGAAELSWPVWPCAGARRGQGAPCLLGRARPGASSKHPFKNHVFVSSQLPQKR